MPGDPRSDAPVKKVDVAARHAQLVLEATRIMLVLVGDVAPAGGFTPVPALSRSKPEASRNSISKWSFERDRLLVATAMT